MVLKPWLKIDTNENNETILKSLKSWILTWFREVENREEYRISRCRFDDFLSSNLELIGARNQQILNNILSAITCNEEHCLHFYYMSSTTFKFIGDSIVEASNGVLRKHITANSSLVQSSEIQKHVRRKFASERMQQV